jgi:formylglycine-generating enzyme required for sulfatase activity
MMRAARLAVVLIAALVSVSGRADYRGADMVTLPAGSYVPFYVRDSVKPGRVTKPISRTVVIRPFRLDRFPVTNAQFLAFVQSHPEWRRSQIKSVFADAHYLAHWRGELVPRNAADSERPVTNVSWFAAAAYCRANHKVLPTTDQWEYALANRGTDTDAIKRRILAWYSTPANRELPAVRSGAVNGYGVGGLVGSVWEWTRDFNSMMSGPDLRGAQAGAQFCGGSSLGATDASDYAAFMRYAMRQSLKASYTVSNLGFRCALDTP